MRFPRKKRTKTSLPYYCFVSGVLHCRAQVITTAYHWETFTKINVEPPKMSLERGKPPRICHRSFFNVILQTSWYYASNLCEKDGLKFSRFLWSGPDCSVEGRWLKFRLSIFSFLLDEMFPFLAVTYNFVILIGRYVGMPVRSSLLHIAQDSTLRGRSSPREASQEATQRLVQLQAKNRKDWIARWLLRTHSFSSSRSLHQSSLGRRAWRAKRMPAQEAIFRLCRTIISWIKLEPVEKPSFLALWARKSNFTPCWATKKEIWFWFLSKTRSKTPLRIGWS